VRVKTKDKILALGEKLLHQHGYNGFSYADISSQLNIKNAAIHYHYPSKAHLVTAIIEEAQKRLEHWMHHLELYHISPSEKLDKFFQIYDGNCYADSKMCLVTSLSSDYTLLPEEVKVAIGAFINSLTHWFAHVLQQGIALGVFHFAGDANARAAVTQTSLMGALLLNRSMGHKTYEIIKNQLKKDIYNEN